MLPRWWWCRCRCPVLNSKNHRIAASGSPIILILKAPDLILRSLQIGAKALDLIPRIADSAWVRTAWVRTAWVRTAWVRTAWVRAAWVRTAWVRTAWKRIGGATAWVRTDRGKIVSHKRRVVTNGSRCWEPKVPAVEHGGAVGISEYRPATTGGHGGSVPRICKAVRHSFCVFVGPAVVPRPPSAAKSAPPPPVPGFDNVGRPFIAQPDVVLKVQRDVAPLSVV